jgi:hypothetical protein
LLAGAGPEEEGALDFVEQWLGFSPDRGDGSTEGMIVLAVAIVALFALARLVLVRTRARAKPQTRISDK